jgi:hypothetical protein
MSDDRAQHREQLRKLIDDAVRKGERAALEYLLKTSPDIAIRRIAGARYIEITEGKEEEQ